WSLYSSLSLSLSLSLNLVFYVLGLIVLCFWCFSVLVSLFCFFGAALIWSLCSGALVLLCSYLSILVL
ncbi:hypothetical protein EDC96DRAFT_539091, partial [Choanephora cucurbitarum]